MLINPKTVIDGEETMKFKLSFILIIFCSLTCLAQKSNENSRSAAPQNIVKKQILVDELDNRTKDIPFAAVRVFVRTRLAEWLWYDGKDETGRAETLAVKALDEIYAKTDEIPESRSLKGNLFSLLEINAKDTANKLRIKYKVGSIEDLSNSASLLHKKGNDKIIAEKFKNALTDTNDLAAIQIHLMMLQVRKSPEFVPLLSEIINLQESGKNNFTTASLLGIANSFIDSAVPNDLKIRFYKIVLERAKNALQTNNGGEIHFADNALFKILPDIAANAPEFAVNASGIKSALSAKTPPKMREMQESYQRVTESTDKLDAWILEARKTANISLKHNFLIEAFRQASKEGKFRLAADLLEETLEDESQNGVSPEFRLTVHDEQLGFLTDDALRKNDVDSAEYAMKKIADDLKKADALRQIATYFIRNEDAASARSNYDEALKLTIRADNDTSKIRLLLGLISAASAIDQRRLPEIISITTKAINNIPTLKPEDKPGTENFKNYVSTVLQIDFILYITVRNLARTNKNEAIYFANQINGKEFRAAADLALAINSFESENKQLSK